MKKPKFGRKKLWKELMSAWGDNDYTCAVYLARLYTQRHPAYIAGWLTLAEVLLPLPPHSHEALHALCRARRLATRKMLPFVYQAAGRFYFSQGNYRRAEAWHRRALNKQEIGEHLVMLGTSLSRQGKFEEAKQCHHRAIEIGSEVADEAHLNLALILRTEENYEEALEHLERAIEIDPEYAIAKRVQRDIWRTEAIKSYIETGINFVRGASDEETKKFIEAGGYSVRSDP